MCVSLDMRRSLNVCLWQDWAAWHWPGEWWSHVEVEPYFTSHCFIEGCSTLSVSAVCGWFMGSTTSMLWLLRNIKASHWPVRSQNIMAPFHCITSTDAAILINMYERLVQIVSSTVSTLLINSPSVLIIVKLIQMVYAAKNLLIYYINLSE